MSDIFKGVDLPQEVIDYRTARERAELEVQKQLLQLAEVNGNGNSGLPAEGIIALGPGQVFGGQVAEELKHILYGDGTSYNLIDYRYLQAKHGVI